MSCWNTHTKFEIIRTPRHSSDAHVLLVECAGSITTPMTCTCNGGGNNVNAERGDYEQKRGEYEDMSANQLIEIFGSPVHAAAVLGSASDIAALVSKGHGFDERDRAGRTPCHVAAIMGNVQNLQTLVDFGANLEVILGGANQHNRNE